MFHTLNRTLLFLYAASSALCIPFHLSTSASSIGAAPLHPLLFMTLLAATASPAHGYALLEKQLDIMPAVAKRNEDWSTPCESQQEEATATVASLGEPVTITVTVFVPPTSNSTATTRPHATSTDLPVETGTESGSSHGNSTNTGSGSPTASPSTTRTTSTPSPSATVDPVLASAEQAQQLNVAFQSLQVTDACTAGERACIGSQLAQCTTPSNPSESPRWVTLACNPTQDQQTVCAAVPDTASSTSTNRTTTVSLGCFPVGNIADRFTAAGATGGMFPPGFQSATGGAGRQHVMSATVTLVLSAVIMSLM